MHHRKAILGAMQNMFKLSGHKGAEGDTNYSGYQGAGEDTYFSSHQGQGNILLIQAIRRQWQVGMTNEIVHQPNIKNFKIKKAWR